MKMWASIRFRPANPIAMIASFGMALRYSFDMDELADKLNAAISAVLAKGLGTANIKSEGSTAGLDDADGRGDPERVAGATRVARIVMPALVAGIHVFLFP
jgi:isocitrate/isopropylmalate dehydrogenase